MAQQPGELYLLVSAESPTFKIGLAGDSYRRSKDLPERFAYESSYVVKLTNGDPFKTERTLLYLFRRDHADKPHGDGYTEWFELEALDEVLAFIEANKVRLGVASVEPLNTMRPTRRQLTAQEREQAKADKEARRVAREKEQAEQQRERWEAATPHNAKVRDALAGVLERPDFVGILKPPQGRYGHSDDYVFYLPRPADGELISHSELLGGLEFNMLHGDGMASVVSSASAYSSYPVAEYRVCNSYFTRDTAPFPFYGEIREILLAKLLKPGSPEWEEAVAHRRFFDSQHPVSLWRLAVEAGLTPGVIGYAK